MIRKIAFSSVILLMMSVFVGESNAKLLKLEFRGSVTSVEGGSLAIGESVSGSLIYDTNTPMSGFPINTSNFNGGISNFGIGGRAVDLVTFNILALTKFYSGGLPDSVGFSVAGWQGEFYESVDVNLGGFDLLPHIFDIPTIFDLSELSSATFTYSLQKIGINDGFIVERFIGDIKSLTVTAVSEPSTLFLFLTSGLLVFIWMQIFAQRKHRNPGWS